MKKQNQITGALLILGLLFSVIVRFNFNLRDGFEITGTWIHIPGQLLDIAVKSSNELFLTSHFVGYIFYLSFALLAIKRIDIKKQINKVLLIIFFALVGMVFLNDFYSWYQDFNHQFTGRHFRIGLLVFLLGTLIFGQQRTNKSKDEKEPIVGSVND